MNSNIEKKSLSFSNIPNIPKSTSFTKSFNNEHSNLLQPQPNPQGSNHTNPYNPLTTEHNFLSKD